MEKHLNKELITEMLDTVYELEGLLRLALSKGESDSRFVSLISRKLSDIGDIISEMDGESGVLEEPAHDGMDAYDSIEEEAPGESTSFWESVDNNDIVDDDDDDDIVEKEEGESATSGNTAASRGGDPARLFSINDKFLYRRVLFGGCDAAMKMTFDNISSMESLSEARRYLVEDLQWDEDNEDVKTFIDIISRYFK